METVPNRLGIGLGVLHTGRVIDELGMAGPLPGAVRRAVQRALAGGKGDAESAGRLLMSVSADVGDGVLGEVDEVLVGADPGFWLALEGARDWLCWDQPGTSYQEPTSADSVASLGVKAVFADGRVRERAVRLLAGSGSLAVLPILGLRAADWASQVREVARDAIVRRLDDDVDAAALVVVAPMALLLGQRRRGKWLAEEVAGRLAGDSARGAATRLLGSANLQLRRAAYQALAEAGALGLERAVQAALDDRDILIRSRCAEYAAGLALDADSTPLIRQMLSSRTPLVRVQALAALNRLGEFDAIQDALADRSGLVRGTARFYLKPRGIDFAEVYRGQLGRGAGTVMPGAVAGLAEVGTAADAGVIAPRLSDPRVKVRVQAIRAFQILAPAIDVEQMLAFIEDDLSSAVVRQATAAILARGARVDPERLLGLLEPSRPMRMRVAAWKLLVSRDSAWRLAVNLMLLADPAETMAARAKSGVEAAIQQQFYTKPSGRAAELVAAYLPEADRLLTPAGARMLRFILGMPREA